MTYSEIDRLVFELLNTHKEAKTFIQLMWAWLLTLIAWIWGCSTTLTSESAARIVTVIWFYVRQSYTVLSTH